MDYLDNLALAYPTAVNRALYRQQPEHFQVYETLDFTPQGQGDHLYLYLEKRNTNTDWLARELARKANLNPADVGYAGRKDRHAVTSQWFSLHLPPSKKISLKLFEGEDYKLLKHSRHIKKLRKGQIAHNRFKLQLTEFDGSFEQFKIRCHEVAQSGFPNYFGPQRFGHGGDNIIQAEAMLSGKLRVKDRNKRSIYLSAARSYLFNKILSKRLESDCWLTPISGDQYLRLGQGELSISGAMAGDGENSALGACLELESAVLEKNKNLYTGIANSRIAWQRRSLRAMPEKLSCEKSSQGVEINFSLQSGAYATSLLRELLIINND
ncbi:MAG: tRNA pseudouridine(13) synthase TruD [Gammaproteobacteria bacterium]|nr:MAG: tRNA pseudouridine(13) synthase TruD [Gammaproteobacteria bacterium]